MMPEKPFSEACLRNQQAIAMALAGYLDKPARVLEVGSGTGQHAVYIAGRLPHLYWQPTELPGALTGIELWRKEARLANLEPALALDINQSPWAVAADFDAVFTANTIHFVGWSTVENLFRGAAAALVKGGLMLVYGPFNEEGRYTSSGNARLDQWLKQRDPESGIKDRQAVIELAAGFGLSHFKTHPMPANNELLGFVRD
jgi:cyclopropane fatty-acyl-phospholipid synthase-like methyltransferase